MRVPHESLPTPVRAAIGLAATVVDEAKHLPERAMELPVQAMGRAMQLSMLAQQRYAALTARGDELLAAREVTDEPPTWATFDDAAEASAAAGDALDATPSSAPVSAPLSEPHNGKPSRFDEVALSDDTTAVDPADHDATDDEPADVDGGSA